MSIYLFIAQSKNATRRSGQFIRHYGHLVRKYGDNRKFKGEGRGKGNLSSWQHHNSN